MILLGVLAGVFALALTCVPLLRRAEEPPPEREEDHPAARLASRKETLYENIRDLDFDHAMGKLTEDDYRAVRATMVDAAAGVLRELDVVGKDEALDRWVEAEVRSRRGKPAGDVVPCAACGEKSPRGARYCDACGAPLGAAACAGCAAPLRPGARFCGACGRKQ